MTDKEEILELYKVFVGTITANEQRRLQLTAVFLTLMAAGVTALGTIKDIDPMYIVAPAFVVSLVWFSGIRHFRRLAKAKFKVIATMERHFSIRPFELEWNIFSSSADGGSTKDENRKPRFRFGLARLEMFVPGALMFLSGLYVLYRLLRMAL